MRVKCIKIFNGNDKEVRESPWLTIEKEYIVLEVRIYPKDNVFYRLVGDNEDKSPMLYKSEEFILVKNNLPSNWKIYLDNGVLIFGPEAWGGEFWEKCYDRDPEALEIYRREASIIYKEEDAL